MNGKGVIFDMDGLMIDSERIIHNALVRGGKEMGLSNVEQVCKSVIGVNQLRTREIFFRAFGDFDYDKLMELKHKYIYEIIKDNGFPPKDGITDILELLSSKGYSLAVGSSSSENAVRKFLGKIDVTKYFNIYVSGDMQLESKPAPDIFLACAERMGIEPANCYVLEDSPNGIRAAYAAGMMPIMIPDMIEPDDDIRSMLFACKKSLREAMKLF